MDDLAALVDVPTSTEAVASLLTLVSGEPFEMPSAAMEKKCRFASPEFVAVTGNTQELDTGRLFHNPEAVNRRLWIHIHAYETGVPNDDRTTMFFDVSKYDRIAGKYTFVAKMDEINMIRFCVREHAVRHAWNTSFRDRMARFDTKCPKCVQPISFCPCDLEVVKIRDGDMPVAVVPMKVVATSLNAMGVPPPVHRQVAVSTFWVLTGIWTSFFVATFISTAWVPVVCGLIFFRSTVLRLFRFGPQHVLFDFLEPITRDLTRDAIRALAITAPDILDNAVHQVVGRSRYRIHDTLHDPAPGSSPPDARMLMCDAA